MHWLDSATRWFVADVWPNLFAALLWAAPTFAWHHRKIKQHIDTALALQGVGAGNRETVGS